MNLLSMERFIDLDIFFWHIYEYVIPVEKEKPLAVMKTQKMF